MHGVIILKWKYWNVKYEELNLIMGRKHAFCYNAALQLFYNRGQLAGQPNKVIPLWCFVAGAPHHVFLGPVVCYQYEASCERANEQPSRDANEARFQKLLVNAHISTKRKPVSVSPRSPSSPLLRLLFGQWLRVNTEISTTCLFLR